MFYQHFIPDETKHFEWVREAKSLPYIKGTGESLKSMLVDYLPSSLTDPGGDPAATPNTIEQQG
jgi:membrane protein required for colicin V production